MRQRVFEHVRANGRAARSDITRALKISAGSATTLTADLIALGVLREVEDTPREAGRGRPPVALEVVTDAAYVIGIKLAFNRHSAVLSDFAGNVVATATTPSVGLRCSLTQLLSEIVSLVHNVAKDSGISHTDVKAIGIGLPGIVDYASGVVTWSSLLLDTNQDLRGAFAEHFDTPLYLDNDTNMLTQSEQWFGAQRDKTDFAVVTIENGVGMGLVINNQLFRGTHGIGLELGHTKVQLEGALCRCGQRGCLEAYLGDYALTREAAVALDIETSGPKSTEQLLEELGRQAKTGNASAQTIFHRAGSYLSVGLANVIQLFDPPLIILSSNQMQLEFLCTDQVFSKAQQLTLSKRSSSCEITICAWDDLVWARGATVPALAALTDTMIGGQPITS